MFVFDFDFCLLLLEEFGLNECCGSGCLLCVLDLYVDEL